MKTENPNLLSPSVLAFVGDAVYGLYVRTALAAVNRPSGELHRLSVTMVNAAAQAKAYSSAAGISIHLLRPKTPRTVIIISPRGWSVFSGGFTFRGIPPARMSFLKKYIMHNTARISGNGYTRCVIFNP